MDNTTFRDVTIRNLDHHGTTGHASAMIGAENVTFDSCRFVTDYPYGLVVGDHNDSPDVSVRFNRCVFENAGSPSSLVYYVGSPNCKQLIIKDGDLSDYSDLINDDDGGLSDFTCHAIYDNFGYSNYRS